MRECELCDLPAVLFCESDQARLCWSCDLKVHSANFLVARHSRNLLCHLCQASTVWKADGAKIGRSLSVCKNCVVCKVNGHQDEEELESESETEDDEESIDVEEDEEENSEDEDNQVVPWSSTTPPPPASPSSSSSEDFSRLSLKRYRENADLCFQDDHECLPSSTGADKDDEVTSAFGVLKPPSKQQKREPLSYRSTPIGSNSVLLDSLRRLHQEDTLLAARNASSTILEIYKLSKGP